MEVTVAISRRVKRALQEAGAVLKRQQKHYVFEVKGRNVVMAKTSSDRMRGEANVLRDIRRAVGRV